jgi:hypothetical protein
MPTLDRNKALVHSWLYVVWADQYFALKWLIINVNWNQMATMAVSALFSVQQQVTIAHMSMTWQRYCNQELAPADNTTIIIVQWTLWKQMVYKIYHKTHKMKHTDLHWILASYSTASIHACTVSFKIQTQNLVQKNKKINLNINTSDFTKFILCTFLWPQYIKYKNPTA